MPVSDDYLAFVIERFECVGQVSARRMFGGAGLYLDGLFFALVSDDTLYLKTAESNRGDYEAFGMAPFSPFGTYAMSYHELPARILDDDSQLEAWAARALDAASEKKPPSRRKAKR